MVNLITEHIDIWSAAQMQKINDGRGRGKNSNGQSPHGIKKLRELILELAVRGKLVPQDPNDEPSSVLLEKIAKEKTRLIKEGKIKKQKPFPEISEDEKPFKLPEGWEWVRLGHIATFENGDRSSRYPKDNDLQPSGIPFFGAKDMVDGELRFDNGLRFISEDKFSKLSNGKLCNQDFVIILRGTVGKMAIFRANPQFPTGFINAQMIIVRMLNKDLCNFFSSYSTSAFFQSLVANKTTGSAVRQMPANALVDFQVPLPPLPEQERIVAKVAELMALCGQLEQQQTDSSATHQTLLETLLATLTNAADQKESAKAWQRIANHFDTLFTTEQSIDQLKQTILQLAVMGKLVPQDPNNEPASELLKRINAEKEKLITEGKIKKQKPLSPITENEIPYELPQGWEWVSLGSVAEINMGQSPPGNSYNYKGKGVPLINGPVEFSKGAFGQSIKSKFTTAPTKMCKKGNLLICVRGSTTGRTNIADFDACIGRGVAAIHSYLNQNYMNWFIVYSRDLIYSKGSGSTFPNIPYQKLASLLVSLPPFAEQKRIVAKVDQLMDICNTLKARLNDAQTTQVQLADAIV